MVYKATKSFIYRAKLYTVGQELPDKQCQRMIKDKVAIRRGIPNMVALQELIEKPKNQSKKRSKK